MTTEEQRTRQRERWFKISRLIKAMSHPFRAQALIVLSQRVASPNELANELDENLERAAYHIRVLRELECIELVDTRPRRGATEHFYRSSEPSVLWGDHWGAVPLPVRESTASYILTTIFTDATASFNAGKFEGHPERHLSRTPMLLDQQGWEDLNALQDESLERTLEIRSESANRIAEGTSSFHVESAQLTFVMATPSDHPPMVG